eukprot:CAMPEP_0204901820 /NCGR_PEP_ID=MMETSP1397-20131031/3299_1 /ASSEMBLY_ACC=CAM_ASM_000891 /TAXON_ID=49980 /ORGANISM="Climacostomum Climacostomum virens, Strain Stock W-24" /LENGTH=293 /DNA_ID=CAMNT_0052070231 /DNA_START=94 /DNA_END=975 /DNA_ORIENTATION=-
MPEDSISRINQEKPTHKLIRGLNKLDTKRRSDKVLRTPQPLPRGDSAYAKAKKAEYTEKNLSKAEHYYKTAIERGERVESAVKDLAGVLHQQGKTREACDFLIKYRSLFLDDQTKYDNLLQNLQKQVIPSGNCLNKSLRLSGFAEGVTFEEIKKLFRNPRRIRECEFLNEDGQFYVVLKFASHSAARKTLEGFHSWDQHKVEWISVTGDITGEASYMRLRGDKTENFFASSLFSLKDPCNKAFALPIDTFVRDEPGSPLSQENVEDMLGRSLLSCIWESHEFKAATFTLQRPN